MLISDKIFEILKSKKISQKAFSITTGIPQSTISDWKSKNVNPQADKIMIICKALGITPVDLLADTDNDYSETDYILLAKGSPEYCIIESFKKMDPRKRRLLAELVEELEGK